ncbi:metallophosphoesterase family protein [Prolixibacteraceae bacterium Z1-6]|uniref:Metallophosphoesterase family protein n=1 Tax=Draconibacterium aestuarii TaxID=2998507 RepID=A0A9X3J874_9BACT|nr:metallophosphoesterase family protein [Prolixibacteraceae bacterium Z1-6]
MEFKNSLKVLLVIVAGVALVSCSEKQQAEVTVKQIISDKVTGLYQTKTHEELEAISYDQAFNMFSEEERQVLATGHWMFDVNVPAVVSVMRSKKQKIVPFWLASEGFKRTNMTLQNEMTEYEIWQKRFDAGKVGLGINGFENYGLHYFVCVGPQNKTDKLELSNLHPANQYVGVMDNGAFTYHDWDELVLFDVPEELKGQQLLTTVRGRGTESHFVGAFRKTAFPSSEKPDQVMLTWSDDPATTIDIQWRTNTTVETGTVNYRLSGSNEVSTVEADKFVMEDLLLMNDRYIHRFTAQLKNLIPGKTYEYKISGQSNWSEKQTFSTAANNDSFSFIWFGDTHHSPEWGEIANAAFNAHPDAAFYSIAGDQVSDGLYRNQWDDLFGFSSAIISQRPFMNVIGNHDNRAGLGAWMFREMYSYPKNGPKDVHKEHTYSFTYKNALFLMIDATAKDELQTAWIEDQLKNTEATWKFAFFHFPPYNWEEPYFNIQKEWIPVFDKYHVDMVFSGHIHYYMRSNPMKAGEVVDSYNNGTAYIISIGINSRSRDIGEEPYAAVRKAEGQFYQYLKIEGNELKYSAIDADNKIIDSIHIKK